MFEEGITTVKECVTTRSGQAFVALEYGGQCWNNWGTRHMDGREKLPDSSCANAGTTNPDSSGNIMGGSYSAAVYSTVPVLTKLSNIANANKNYFNKLYVESCNTIGKNKKKQNTTFFNFHFSLTHYFFSLLVYFNVRLCHRVNGLWQRIYY